MRVALVYDRVNKFGGAERVLKTLHKIYPEAPLLTLVYNKQKAGWSKDFRVIPTFLNNFSFLRDNHEILAPLAPMAFETFNFDKFDVVISITSSDAKSVITKPGTLHICYCLTPTRYFWSGKNKYASDIKMKILPKSINKYLRTVDLLTSQRPDEYIAISKEVKNRIKKYYQRDSKIIYPSIEDIFYSEVKPESNLKRDYYLLVSRLVPYKSVDLAVKAFNLSNKKLIIVGEGSERARLQAMAGKNIQFLGQIDDPKLIRLYQKAKAVIFPQEEDYGLVPIEAQACGTPVIAFRAGGARETIIDKVTGIFFNKKTVKSLSLAIDQFENMKIDYRACVSQAKKFSEKKFISEFSQYVNESWKKYQKSLNVS